MAQLCEHCEAPVADTCFVTDPWGGNKSFICEDCQERAYDRHQERLMEDGGGPSLDEQIRQAWKIKHGILP